MREREKATSYYLHNHVFFAKMDFFVLILALEIWPMITLMRWRTISSIEAALVIAMVIAAVMMARGYESA